LSEYDACSSQLPRGKKQENKKQEVDNVNDHHTGYFKSRLKIDRRMQKI
jgi:hypothetical protein